jgi:hypothetical protein
MICGLKSMVVMGKDAWGGTGKLYHLTGMNS